MRRHRIDIFFEIGFSYFKDITWKTYFLRCISDVLKTSEKNTVRVFWDVSVNGNLIEISQRHLMAAGNVVSKLWINVQIFLIRRWKWKENPLSDFRRCIKLMQRQCLTLKQRRNNVAQRRYNFVSTFFQRSLDVS